MKASIIISTRGRIDIFRKSIKSISEKVISKDFQIIVINNNQDQNLSEQIHLSLRNSKIVLENEPTPGLSYARNKGIAIAQFPWLIFLDDDVQINETFLPKALKIINSDQFDCFGGMYYPWYLDLKPKWISSEFGKKKPLRSDTGLIHLPEDGFLSAGIMAIKKEALETVGGFRTDLGMSETIGYGEENDLQLKLQAAGYRIGFIPDWYMHHAVLEHKHHVGWHLKSAYASARDTQRIHGGEQLIPILLKLTKSLLAGLLRRFPIGVWQLCTKQDYYKENLILDVLRPIFTYYGYLKGITLTQKQ